MRGSGPRPSGRVHDFDDVVARLKRGKENCPAWLLVDESASSPVLAFRTCTGEFGSGARSSLCATPLGTLPLGQDWRRTAVATARHRHCKALPHDHSSKDCSTADKGHEQARMACTEFFAALCPSFIARTADLRQVRRRRFGVNSVSISQREEAETIALVVSGFQGTRFGVRLRSLVIVFRLYGSNWSGYACRLLGLNVEPLNLRPNPEPQTPKPTSIAWSSEH